MPTKWQEKGVGVLLKRGTSQRKPVVNDKDGSNAGHHVEHWDGRQDAVAKVDTVHYRMGRDDG